MKDDPYVAERLANREAANEVPPNLDKAQEAAWAVREGAYDDALQSMLNDEAADWIEALIAEVNRMRELLDTPLDWEQRSYFTEP